MKQLFLALAIVALALPGSALGKGPTAATMDGPGGGNITFGGDGEAMGTELGNLSQQSGFMSAVFRQVPDPMLDTRPKGNLGPKYTMSWTVPGPSNDVFTIRQDVYPYADPSPVTYLAPGQKIFEMETRGGWFQAGPELKETLVSAGLPATASVASSGGSSFPTVAVSLLVLTLLLVSATAVLLRRRARPAAA
jgi:hypothetical protein